jgi:hypothetical protein
LFRDVLIVGIFATATVADEKWTNWAFTNSATIEFRWKVSTYGPDIPPNCNFEFRNGLGGKASFNYVAAYSWRKPGSQGQKRGAAYQITETEHGGDSIDKCDRILTITISDLKKTN